VPLDALGGLEWLAFPRSDSPAWYGELTAILRSHGLDLRTDAPDGQRLIAEVKLAAVNAGRAFALTPANWSQPIPDGVAWAPLAGRPLVRRTWAVWAAESRRRDLGRLIAALDRPDVDVHGAAPISASLQEPLMAAISRAIHPMNTPADLPEGSGTS
jgi:hypothetical protein